MIVCHEHKFIFVKTRKTAGTSIETALSSLCGPSDVITSLSSEDEAARTQLGLRGMQNIHVPMMRYSISDIATLATLKRKRFHNHSPSSELRKYLGKKMYSKYFVFCVERNPMIVQWASIFLKIVNFQRSHQCPNSLKHFLLQACPTGMCIRNIIKLWLTK